VKIAGLILSGGASQRMGFPKALLDFQGETFLDRLIRVFTVNCSSVSVVLGAEADRIRRGLLSASDVQFVINDQWENGQLSSVQAGLKSLPYDADAVLVTPVDYPAMRGNTVDRVCSTAEQSQPWKFVIPRHEGRRGHPILFDSSLIPEFLALPTNAQARDVVHQYVHQTIYVNVDDPGILKDADDRRAYDELLASQSRNV